MKVLTLSKVKQLSGPPIVKLVGKFHARPIKSTQIFQLSEGIIDNPLPAKFRKVPTGPAHPYPNCHLFNPLGDKQRFIVVFGRGDICQERSLFELILQHKNKIILLYDITFFTHHKFICVFFKKFYCFQKNYLRF